MQWFAELHPVIAHFSIALIPAGLLVYIIYRFTYQEWLLNTSLTLFVFSSLSLVLSYFSGEQVESLVSGIPGVHDAIEQHALWASISTWSAVGLTVLTFFYIRFKDSALRFNQDISYFLVLAAGIWCSYAILMTGTKGGNLVSDYHVAGAVREHTQESIKRQTYAYYYNKLQYMIDKNDIPAVYSLFREIEIQLPENTDFKIMQAQFLFQQLNNPAEALTILDQTLNLIKDPKSRQYYDALVAKYKAYTMINDTTGQLAIKQRLIDLFPESAYVKSLR
ncbi:MAG: hypothetical protein J0L62_09000 [Bacteroidetes bacterium]|nr:hypothetical protein [Bacteroidota bacterium]